MVEVAAAVAVVVGAGDVDFAAVVIVELMVVFALGMAAFVC